MSALENAGRLCAEDYKGVTMYIQRPSLVTCVSITELASQNARVWIQSRELLLSVISVLANINSILVNHIIMFSLPDT
jgi:hypothetical protein